MLKPRIIASLLISNGDLVKTVKFKNSKYIGDPINAARIFNEKEVDELIIFDISATVLKKEPDYKLISKLANQCGMPVCYGGGIKTIEQALKIFALGIEKIALSSAAIENPDLITQISKRVGSQSVVVVLDVKKKACGSYEIFTHNAKNATGENPITFVEKVQRMGAGEVVINAICRDGTMIGYDMYLIDKITEKINIPVTVLGGAGNLNDIKKVIYQHSIIGVAAGSLFLFKGIFNAVLINYPNKKEKEELLDSYY